MTTNLRPRRDGQPGLDWKFDVDVCEDLMNDYSVCDFWPTVNAAAERGRETLHMVRATKGGRWTDEDIQRATHAQENSNAKVLLHNVDAGHWCHVSLDTPHQSLHFSLFFSFFSFNVAHIRY